MKKLSFLLAVLICLTSFNIYAAAGTEAEVPAISEEAIKADEFIKAMDLNVPYTDDFGKKITRIEFLRAVMSALKATAGDGASFTDLSGEDYSLASAAVKLGIISDAAQFNPDREITAAEGYKMAVVATGYALEAELKGGYPTGYIYAASYTDISDGLNLSDTDTLNYADFAVLIRNMCEINIKYQTGYGDSNSYSITDGKNILTTYHGMYITEGIFEANELGSLYSKNVQSGKGKIIIDSTEYKYSGDARLGCKVRAYYKIDGGVKTIVYLEEIYNKSLTVEAKDIADTQNGKLVYYEGTTTKNAKLKTSPAIIYNGVASDIMRDFDSVSITNGSLTLIDNDEDGTYDVVYVDEFYYMFISKLNGKKDAIYDVNNSANTVNFDEDTHLTVKLDGVKADISAITANSGALIYKSENNEKITIELSAKKTNAKIDSINSSDKTVTAKGTAYKYTDYFEAYYLDKVMSLSSSSLVIAPDGKLIAIDSPENNMMIGIIIDAGTASSALDGTQMLKIYTDGGKIEILNLAEKVSVDGQSKESASAVMTKYINTIPLDGSTDANKNIRGAERFIAYALNGDDEICKIDTIYTMDERLANNTPYPDGGTGEYPTGIIDGSENPDDRLRVYKTISGKRYKMNNINNEVALTANTIVYDFNIDESLNEDMRCKLGDRSIFPDDKNINGNLYAICVGQTLSPEYVLRTTATASGGGLDGYSDGGVIEEVSRSIDPQGDDAWKIVLFGEDGNFKTLYANDVIFNAVSFNGTPTTVASGDYIRFDANTLNIVTSLALDYDFSADKLSSSAQDGYNGLLDFYKGYVYSTVPADNFYILAKDDASSYKLNPSSASLEDPTNKNVLFTWGYTAVYDGKTQTITRIKGGDVIGYIDDMANCDYAVIRQRYAQGQLMVVYRNVR